MDNSNRQMNRSTDNLGVNKLGKNIIKKSPVHQPNFANSVRPPQQPQPHVYTIDKNDFRNVVQQLTGSPSHHQEQAPPRMHQNNPPKPSSMRLQKIRPPPLMPINRPYVRVQAPPPAQQQNPPMVPYNNNNHIRPPQQYVQPSPPIRPPFPPGDAWPNTAESPVSAYMRYLQNFIMDPTSRPITPQAQAQAQAQAFTQQPYGLVHNQPHQPAPGLLPNPSMPPLPSPRFHGLPPIPSPRMNGPPPPLPSPRMNGPPPSLPSPRMYGGPLPQMNGPPLLPSPTSQFLLPSPLLPSPTSQFLLPSPTGFMVSPRSSSYPWFSPGFQHPPPLTPNFSFSPMAQSGILGPGPGPQAPPSPNYGFPLSPNGLFPIVSPRWRNQ